MKIKLKTDINTCMADAIKALAVKDLGAVRANIDTAYELTAASIGLGFIEQSFQRDLDKFRDTCEAILAPLEASLKTIRGASK